MPSSARDKQRVFKRASLYQWSNNTLYRILPEQNPKLVPKPEERISIVKDMHETLGHLGHKRTLHALAQMHWWRGMRIDVQRTLLSCKLCDRVRACSGYCPKELQPLPIRGINYRWGLDYLGPFPDSADPRNNRYALIMIEHFSKWLEVAPVKEATAATTAFEFLHRVISRFGLPAEVVHDNGSHFKEEFTQLLKNKFIKDRHTSPEHAQANGLAERAVQTVKRSLKKYVAQHRNPREWDSTGLAAIVAGYNATVQSSTGYSPSKILFGQEPFLHT
jgi:transposase InsO family protein